MTDGYGHVWRWFSRNCRECHAEKYSLAAYRLCRGITREAKKAATYQPDETLADVGVFDDEPSILGAGIMTHREEPHTIGSFGSVPTFEAPSFDPGPSLPAEAPCDTSSYSSPDSFTSGSCDSSSWDSGSSFDGGSSGGGGADGSW